MRKTKKSKNTKSLSSNFLDFFKNSKTSKIKSSTHLLTHSKPKIQDNKILSSFYTFNNPINTRLIKYTDPESKLKIKNSINNIKLVESYEFPTIIENFKRLDTFYIEEKKIMKELKIKKTPPHVKHATEDLTRGLRTFVNSRYTNLPKTISNAFVKLWEVFEKFDIMSQKSKSFRVFHIAEAPGMITLCTQYFAKTKRPNITDYDWRANSLNPYNKDAQKMGALRDEYGLIKSNPKKWLWGADNTGDITNTKNIKSFKDYINKKWLTSNSNSDSNSNNNTKLDLITGDAGTDPNIDTMLLQKLDLAQAITTVVCSHIGGNSCVKHFSPYITSNPDSIEATSFFISYIYLYYICFKEVSLYKPYTSNGDSGEFYIVCKDFIGIDNSQIEKLYKCLDTFKTNYSIFPKDSIPDTFILQVNSFIGLLCNLNIQAIEKTILLLNCYKDTKNKNKNNINSYCDNLLNDSKLDNILIPRFNQWINEFNFV